MVYHGTEQGGTFVVILQAVMILSTTYKGDLMGFEVFLLVTCTWKLFSATDLFTEIIFLQFG